MLVVKPGELTLEFVRGHRARFISPVRLYLTCSVLYFALASISPPTVIRFSEADKKEVGERTLERAEEIRQEVGEQFVHDMPRGMFLLMPIFGLLTWAFYHRTQPYYVPHLYYSLHFHAFAFLVLAVRILFELTGRYGAAAGKLLVIPLIAYHYLALRRVFGGTRAQTAWKGSAIGILYSIAMIATFLGIALLIIRMKHISLDTP